MRIAILTDAYPPQSLGGTAITVRSIARRFAKVGHKVFVLLIQKRAVTTPICYDQERDDAIRVIRAGEADIAKHLESAKPEGVIATGRRAPHFVSLAPACGPEPVIYLQDAFSDIRSVYSRRRFVFASRFLSEFYGGNSGTEMEVIPPLVEPHAYAGINSDRTTVTAFGLSRIKRPDIVFHAAKRLKDVKFEIFQTWGSKLRLRNIPILFRRNLVLLDPVDMPKMVYSRSRVIVVPSNVEGWCRVVTEGQLAGIPTIARSSAALPESVGDGGVLLAPDATREAWVAAIRRVFEDEGYYRELVAAARRAAARPTISPEWIMARWSRALGC